MNQMAFSPPECTDWEFPVDPREEREARRELAEAVKTLEKHGEAVIQALYDHSRASNTLRLTRYREDDGRRLAAAILREQIDALIRIGVPR